MKILKYLSILFTTITIFTSCEKEIPEPYNPPHHNPHGNHPNGNNNGNTTIDEDYPNLSGDWLFVEGTRYVHTEGMASNDTYEVTDYVNGTYEYVFNNPICHLDSIKTNTTVWEFTYSDLLVDYTHQFYYTVGFQYQTIEINVASTKRIYTLIDYDNYDQTLTLRTTNQEWLGYEEFVDSDNNGQYAMGETFTDSNNNGIWDMVPKYQYSILKFYKGN